MIKKTLFLFCAFPLTFWAQEFPNKEDLIPVDDMQVKVQYDVKFRYAHKKDNQVKHDKMYTEIGKTVCHSYIEREWNNEISLNKSFIERGKRNTNAFASLYSNIGEVFMGYPKGKNTVIYSLDVLGTYKYEEPIKELKWTIRNETLDTLGYHCTMATCTYAGREYKAWFTEEIPLSYGPWKLGGLPGLIIKAETIDGDYSFVLSGIESIKDSESINLWKRDFVNSTRKKTRKQEVLLLSRPDAILDQMGINYTVKTFSGTPVKLKFFCYDNPLEKE